MSDQFQITIRDSVRETHQGVYDGSVLLGRQDRGEPEPIAKLKKSKACKLVVAHANENNVSREQLLVTMQDSDTAVLKNVSKKIEVQLTGSDVTRLTPGESCEIALPVEVSFDNSKLHILIEQLQVGGEETEEFESFAWQTIKPEAQPLRESALLSYAENSTQSLLSEELPPEFISWLKAAVESCVRVFQSSISSDEFFDEGARAVVDIASMDTGRVLLRENDNWVTRTTYPSQPRGVEEYQESHTPSKRIIARVLDGKRTYWQTQNDSQNITDSLSNVSAVVASPILDSSENVIGVLYGNRHSKSLMDSARINRIEAMLVDLLACGISVGLERMKSEQAKVQFEQFFTPSLARRLMVQPDLLKGKERPVSVMFCDISGFSTISENLDTTTVLAWIHDALSIFSQCILDTGGVLVDFVGDEIMAMWGAPDAIGNHAEQACQAAIKIVASLPELNEKWRDTIGEETAVRIGINSGLARVGNTGSKQKFKYGALGTTVNFAARIQGATKHLRTRLLASEATCNELPEDFPRRRLCNVKVMGITSPIGLFELCASHSDQWDRVKHAYEKALELAEAGSLEKAVSLLGRLLEHTPDDGPSLVLLSRITEAMLSGIEGMNPVWELSSK